MSRTGTFSTEPTQPANIQQRHESALPGQDTGHRIVAAAGTTRRWRFDRDAISTQQLADRVHPQPDELAGMCQHDDAHAGRIGPGLWHAHPPAAIKYGNDPPAQVAYAKHVGRGTGNRRDVTVADHLVHRRQRGCVKLGAHVERQPLLVG